MIKLEFPAFCETSEFGRNEINSTPFTQFQGLESSKQLTNSTTRWNH
jgi:hypothetical protein